MRLDRGWILLPILSLVLAGCSRSSDPTGLLQPTVQPGTDGTGDADRNSDDDVRFLGDTFAGKIKSIHDDKLHIGDLTIHANKDTEIGNQDGVKFGLSGLTVGNAVVLQIRVKEDNAIVATKITQVQDAKSLPLLTIQGRTSHVSNDRKTFEIAGILFHVNNTSHFGTGFEVFKDIDNDQVVRIRGKLRPNGDLTMRRADLVTDHNGEFILPTVAQNRPH